MIAPKTESYALLPDKIWDGASNHAIANTAVVVDGMLIKSLIPMNDLTAEFTKVTLEGCTLIPGLIDAHTHYSSVMGPAFLAAGVTTIRDVGNDLEWILSKRADNESNASLGPTIFCCGNLQDGEQAYWPRMGKANPTPAAVRESVQRHAAAGVNAIKLYDGLYGELFAAAVEEGHKHNLFVTAHLVKTGIEEAISMGVDGIEHLSRCDVAWENATSQEDDVLIDMLVKNKVALDPTLVVWDRLGRIMDTVFAKDARRKWVHPTHVFIWDNYRTKYGSPENRLRLQHALPCLKRFLLRAHKRGVTIGLGTDTPFPHLIPGFSVHDELSMYVDAGIKPIDALRSATSVNAQILGSGSTVGQINPGMIADMVAVRGNPLEAIETVGNIETVIHKGILFKQDSLLKSVQSFFEAEPKDTITQDLLDVTWNAPV